MKYALLPALLLALSLIAACGSYEVQGDIGHGITLNIEEFVERPWKPQIYLRPEDVPDRPLSAIIFPFKMRQSIKDPVHYSKEVTRCFWQMWLRQRVFPVLEFAENTVWPGGEAGVSMARAKGADLAIGGDITHFISGGSLGDSQLSLRLEIYDTISGSLIWSIAHAGIMTNRGTQDFILFSKKSRLPADPIYAITVALASDLSRPLNNWLQPMKEKMKQEKDCPNCPADGRIL